MAISFRAAAAAAMIVLLCAAQTNVPRGARAGAAPRVEVLGPKLVALRFDPRLIHDRHVTVDRRNGRLVASAGTEFHYRVPLPYWLERAQPESVDFGAELESLGTVTVAFNGVARDAVALKSPAMVMLSAPLRPAAEIDVHITAPQGVTIHGAGGGGRDFDPVLLVHTSNPVNRHTGEAFDDNVGEPLPPLRPLFDYDIRDTSICLGGDGMYYLTGTTGSPDMWAVTGALQLWKSPDMKSWTPVIERPRTRSVVWDIDRDGTWEKPVAMRDGAPFRPLWAPEVHFAKGTYWLTYSIPNRGAGLLKSTSGKPEGPYMKAFADDQPVARGIDASLFEDDDGELYFLYSGGQIARMKDDLSGLAEPFHSLKPSNAPYVGFEGVYLFKRNGKYYLSAADFVLGDYHAYIAMADHIYGPYGDRYLAVPHGGHNVYWQDKAGDWWSSFFGNDAHSPFRERAAALRIEFDAHGRVRVMNPQP